MRWSLSVLALALVVSLLAAVVAPARAVTITFTGDVEADFPSWALYNDPEGVGDVGVPPVAPAGTAVGWDIETVGLVYEESTDTLYVGFNMGGDAISSDADGDGDPGQTAPWLDTLTGTDLANLTGTEAIDLLIDVDQSCQPGTSTATDYEVVAGIPNTADAGNFAVATFSQDLPDFTTPGAGHATPTYSGSLFASPSATQPDLEFQIDNFCSQILSLSGSTCTPGVTPISFAFAARAGSQTDAGIGEDTFSCTGVNYTPTAVEVSSVEASTATGPSSMLGLLTLPLLLLIGSIWMVRLKRHA